MLSKLLRALSSKPKGRPRQISLGEEFLAIFFAVWIISWFN